jgi:hypothetical protein
VPLGTLFVFRCQSGANFVADLLSFCEKLSITENDYISRVNKREDWR